MKEQRPKLNMSHSAADQVLEITGWMLVIGVWALVIVTYPTLPETIPTHFNASGQVDGSGQKELIWTLPIIGTILFAGLTILNKHPHLFNYPVAISPHNALTQYRRATKLIRYLKLSIISILMILTQKTIQTAREPSAGLGAWFLPLALVLIFIPLTVYIISSVQKDQ